MTEIERKIEKSCTNWEIKRRSLGDSCPVINIRQRTKSGTDMMLKTLRQITKSKFCWARKIHEKCEKWNERLVQPRNSISNHLKWKRKLSNEEKFQWVFFIYPLRWIIKLWIPSIHRHCVAGQYQWLTSEILTNLLALQLGTLNLLNYNLSSIESRFNCSYTTKNVKIASDIVRAFSKLRKTETLERHRNPIVSTTY